ncbi:MAG: GAF domain-containing protein [Candidatus Promineifilaceae bacterium]|nr:GAF domain-containing protein [Candidatus Promineifilaceae bacterium]
MQKLKERIQLNLSVGQRIGATLVLMALLVLLSGGLGLYFADTSAAALSQTHLNLLQLESIAGVEQEWAGVTIAVDGLLLSQETSRERLEEVRVELRAFNAELNNLEAAVSARGGSSTGENELIIGRLRSWSEQLNRTTEEILTHALAEQWEDATALRQDELASAQHRFDQNLSAISNTTERDVRAALAETQEVQTLTERSWIALIVVALLAAFLLGSVITSSVLRPVEELTEGAEKLAAGQLDERVTLDRNDELGQLAAGFNTMAERLQRYYGVLEERVAERTKALRTSVEVSRRLSTILDRQELVAEVVKQVQDAFGYYHVHIYLLDEERQKLVMAGGTGAAAREMLARNHQLKLGQGLVGRAAVNREVVLEPDVAQAPGWLSNPLLPETKAEVAVPIIAGDEVLGVIDVQHDVVDGLGQSDAELVELIASQVAVALENARLVEATRERAERATMVSAIGQKIQRALTVEEVLRVAAQELGQAFAVESASVQLSRARLHDSNGDHERES